MIGSALLLALSALPLPEAVDFALARWPRADPGVLAVAVSVGGPTLSPAAAETLRAEMVNLVRGRALEAGLAEAVVALAADDGVVARARAAGAEHLLLLELAGTPVDTMELRIVAVDPGGLWGPRPDARDPPMVARARVAVAPPPAATRASTRGQALTFFRVSAVAERPLALAVCRGRRGVRHLVVLMEDGVVTFEVRARQLGEPNALPLALPPANEPVRAPFGHAVCAPGDDGGAAVGHGRASGGVFVEGNPPRLTGPLAGLPLASDGSTIVWGRPAGGTNVLEPTMARWPEGEAPSPPEPSRALVYDDAAGWLFVTVRGPVVDRSGREWIPRTGAAIAAGGGFALVSAPQLDEGRDWVRLWDLRRQRWATAPHAFASAVLAVATDGALAFAVVEGTGPYPLYVAKLPPPEPP